MPDKMMHIWWIVSLIAITGEEASWVVGGPRVKSYQIIKNTLNFKGKVWWTLSRHRLCPTTKDNVLSLVHTALTVGFIERYEFDISQFISRDIRDQVVCTNVILASPC